MPTLAMLALAKFLETISEIRKGKLHHRHLFFTAKIQKTKTKINESKAFRSLNVTN